MHSALELPAIRELLGESRVCELGPGSPNQVMHAKLKAMTLTSLFGDSRVQDRDAAKACLAGLWLYHDFLDESHTISQGLHTPEGSFWHAIMHRREPDAWNSKYWWRKVGNHPVLTQLRDQCRGLGYSFTTPSDFVDCCEKVRGRNNGDEHVAKQVQLLEWQLLFSHCHALAIP